MNNIPAEGLNGPRSAAQVQRGYASGHASRITHYVHGVILCASLCLAAAGAPLDPEKLPPPAQGTAAFDRDIRPIFEKTCFRCHGPERPKSHFRLDDRDAALKGGANGVDIIPGNSAKSPLVYYVARLIEDMEMPPVGKGDPLTPEQVGLLRAWIDQGATWGATNPPTKLTASVTPVGGGFFVSGDQSKFREVEGFKDGFRSGLEQFSVEERIGLDKRFSLEGHALFPDDDVQIKLGMDQTDFGFVRAGFEQWRRYYDDTGGYYRPFATPSYDLGRDLHLDIGRAWMDWGLTLPHWPQLLLGYEYQFKQGAKSTLEWGPVDGKNIFPAAMEVDEHTHIIKLDASHDLLQWHLEDNARVEFYAAKNQHDDATKYTLGPAPDSTVRTSQDTAHVQGMNTLHLERQLRDWWLVSGGYLYSKLDGSASLNQVTVNSVSAPVAGTFWSADDVVLKRESQIVSFSNLLRPASWLNVSLGLQSEWTRQEGAGNIRLDSGDPSLPDVFTQYPAVIRSDLDQQKLGEDVSVRFTAIPWTVLFAEGRFAQDRIGQFEQDAPASGTTADPSVTFLRNTDFANDRRELRAGFDTSPWRWIALRGHYRHRLSDSDYDNTKDPPSPGYSAFIRARILEGDETQVRLVLRPIRWLQAALTYQWLETDYSTTTGPVPGGSMPTGLLAGSYDARIYGIGLTLTPIQRLYFSGALTFSDTRTRTAANGDPSVVPYRGDIYGLTFSANYTLDSATSLQAAYSFSRADYGQQNVADGLPLGINYTRHGLMLAMSRRLTSRLSATLRYGFYQYDEPSSGGANDYTAHGVFLALAMKLP